MDIPDTFVANVIKHNDSLRITIPIRLSEYMRIKEGDQVKVLIKKEE